MKNTLNEKQEQFNRECKLINLKYEYQGYKGTPKWAIVSDYSEKEIMEKYAEVIGEYVPFVLLTLEQDEAIKEYERIEDKYKKRVKRYGHIFNVTDGEFENHHPELCTEPDYVEDLEMNENIHKLYKAINTLTDVQKRRVVKHFFDEKSYETIACEENVTKQSIEDSIKASIKKIKKFF